MQPIPSKPQYIFEKIKFDNDRKPSPTGENYVAIPLERNIVATEKKVPENSSRQPVPLSTNGERLPLINYSELIMDKEIGRGAFGVVFKGRWRGGAVAISKLHRLFFLPIFKKEQLLLKNTLTDKEMKDFQDEAAVMASLRWIFFHSRFTS